MGNSIKMNLSGRIEIEMETEDFLETLRKRARQSKVYRSYQLTGLEISQLLEDEQHKALYIKLAKEGSADRLLALAKEVRDRKNVKKRGAYFMKLLTQLHGKPRAWDRGAGLAKSRKHDERSHPRP